MIKIWRCKEHSLVSTLYVKAIHELSAYGALVFTAQTLCLYYVALLHF